MPLFWTLTDPQTNRPPRRFARVAYVQDAEDDEDLAHFSTSDRQPKPYDGSSKHEPHRSLESSNDSSESEPLDVCFRREPVSYDHRPAEEPKRWVKWDDADDLRNSYSDSSSSSVGIDHRHASNERYHREREREKEEEEARLRRVRRKLAKMRSREELPERQRIHSTSDNPYSSDSVDIGSIHISHRRGKSPTPVQYISRNRSRSRDRSHRRSYVPPISADRDDNDAQLAETLLFDLKDQRFIEDARRSNANAGSMLQAWFRKRASFGDDVDTELVVINAAESFTDEKAKSVVTLYCQKDALDHVKPAPRQIYWL